MKVQNSGVFGAGVAIGALMAAVVGGAYLAAVGSTAHAQPVNPPRGVESVDRPTSFADIVAKVAPAVVSIDVVERPTAARASLSQAPPFPFNFGMPNGGDAPHGFGFKWLQPQAPGQPAPPIRAAGSGFFISSGGYIVTNNHVVEDAEKITVRTSDGRSLPATVVGRDRATDLAVLRVAGGPYPFVSFENRAQPRVGDWVVAVGNPFGLGGTATAGIVSALGRENISGSSFVNYMQIDAPINHGNSGGPTFDVDGRVVGVNTAIYSPSGGSIGIGFDIPASVAASVTQQLIEHGKVSRGYVGATVQTLTPELASSLGLRNAKGVVVDQLAADGPAAHSGLRAGDVIVSVDGRPATDADDVTQLVAQIHPGDEIDLGVLRDGVRRKVRLVAGLRPTEASLTGQAAPGDDGGAAVGPAALGMKLAPDPDGGLLVQSVAPDSSAASHGLQEGDVILRAGMTPVRSAADLARAASAARQAGRAYLPLLIARGDAHIYVPVRIKKAVG